MRSKHTSSLVSVFEAVDGRKGDFLRYETPSGVPCDEHGVRLGVITFKDFPPDPEDEEETGLEPEEIEGEGEGLKAFKYGSHLRAKVMPTALKGAFQV
tara:strand:+ start:225 stop:518 length:294 start_codon:yes stop_codon:yes gene_type:complete